MSASGKVWVNNNAPQVEDDDLNGFNIENNNLIEGSNQTLNTGDNQQTHQAVARYSWSGNVLDDASTGVNAVVLAVVGSRIVPATENGMKVRWQNTEFANTSAVTLNVGTLGTLDLRDSRDAALKGGELELGPYYEAVFDSANNRWRLLSGSTVTTGTFTPTWIGFSVNPTGVFTWTKVDYGIGETFVTITAPLDPTGTSNSAGMSWSSASLPTDVRPSENRELFIQVIDTNADKIGNVQLQPGGVAVFSKYDPVTDSFSTGGFTSSGTKGLQGGVVFQYTL